MPRVTLACALLLALLASLRASPEHLVWHEKPAAHFTESTPLGNGRLGAMVFGGVTEERIVLNEAGLWSGSPQDADRPDASQSLPEIRRLLLEGKNAEAEALVYDRYSGKKRSDALNPLYEKAKKAEVYDKTRVDVTKLHRVLFGD